MRLNWGKCSGLQVLSVAWLSRGSVLHEDRRITKKRWRYRREDKRCQDDAHVVLTAVCASWFLLCLCPECISSAVTGSPTAVCSHSGLAVELILSGRRSVLRVYDEDHQELPGDFGRRVSLGCWDRWWAVMEHSAEDEGKTRAVQAVTGMFQFLLFHLHPLRP